MSDLFNRVLLLGIGAASLTKDKIEELIDELVKKGQLTADEGREVVEEATKKAKQESSNIKEMAADTYQDTLRAMGIATRDHIDELDRRLDVLEAKVYGKRSRVEEPATGFASTTTEEEAPS